MPRRLHADKKPCSSCPYACSTPAGVWHADEYDKLPAYDHNSPDPAVGIFLCHHSPHIGERLCRGWLTVHSDSLAVRVGVATGAIDPDERDQEVHVDLYPTGAVAAEAGKAGIESPDSEALQIIDRLYNRMERRNR